MGIFSIDKAISQYDNNIDELNDLICKKPVFKPLLEAIVHIREHLSEAKIYDIGGILFRGDAHASFLDYFEPILNPDEHLVYPKSLCELFNGLSYNILDDGYLRICRIEVFDDCNISQKNTHITELNTTIKCFLTTQENWDKQEDVGQQWLDRHGNFWLNPKMVSFKMDCFETIERFTDFMKLLGKKSNWKSLGFNFSVLDTLFFK